MAVSFQIKTEYIVYATPEEVFEALTDSGIIAAWGGGLAVVDNTIGGVFELFDGWVKGKVIRFEPGIALGYTWRPTAWRPTDVSIVHIEFEEAGKKLTKITIHHDGFPNKKEHDSHENGWKDFVIAPLKEPRFGKISLSETIKSLPMYIKLFKPYNELIPSLLIIESLPPISVKEVKPSKFAKLALSVVPLITTSILFSNLLKSLISTVLELYSKVLYPSSSSSLINLPCVS